VTLVEFRIRKLDPYHVVLFVILRLAVVVELRLVTDTDRQTDTDTGPWLVLLLLLLYMSIIMVALSHYCCRTTLQCQCHAESQSTEKHSLNSTVFSS